MSTLRVLPISASGPPATAADPNLRVSAAFSHSQASPPLWERVVLPCLVQYPWDPLVLVGDASLVVRPLSNAQARSGAVVRERGACASLVDLCQAQGVCPVDAEEGLGSQTVGMFGSASVCLQGCCNCSCACA